MRQLILAVRGAEFQASKHFQHFGMNTSHTCIKSSLFAGFDDGFLHLFFLFVEDLFNVRRMDAAIQDQPVKRTAGDLAPHRVKTGDRYCFRGVIHDHIHTGSLLKGADIASVPTHDTPFHFLVRQGHQRGGYTDHVL